MFLSKIRVKVQKYSREQKYDQLFKNIEVLPENTILEVGVANNEYSNYDNYFIKKYPYKQKITALGIDDLTLFMERYPEVQAVVYDGHCFPFKDKQFNVAHSNAVIEHVGGIEKQKFFLNELLRVSKKGMLTTPNKYFPIETHTSVPVLHWLSKNKFDAYLKMIGKGWATGDYMNLLTKKDLKSFMDDADVNFWKIISNRFWGLTLTFTLIWSDEPLD